MRLRFTKMHGCGNDYLYVNCFEQEAPNPGELAVRLSDRHTGVGGDGIILIGPSPVADARMRIFNADGSEGRMCGNGVRCVGKYLYDRGLVSSTLLRVDTLSGVRTLQLHLRDGAVTGVTVDMGRASFDPADLPARLPGPRAVDLPLAVGGAEWRVTCVSMGNPHCVAFVADPDALDLERLGPLFERHPAFPEGVNTEFVRRLGPNELELRVWERGSGETMACGTGACAAAAAAVETGQCERGADVAVRLRGGVLSVRCTGGEVTMTGEAVEVFRGEVEV